MNKQIKTQLGFTLIELIVVMSLIGVMIAVVLRGMDPINSIRRSRDSARKEDLTNIAKAIELYREKYESLPQGSYNYCTTLSGVEGSEDSSIYEDRIEQGLDYDYTQSWLKALVVGGVVPQVSIDPDYPDGVGYYEYWANQAYKSSMCWEYVDGRFVLVTGLEYTEDPDCVVDENGVVYDWRNFDPPRCMYLLQNGSQVDALKDTSGDWGGGLCPETLTCT